MRRLLSCVLFIMMFNIVIVSADVGNNVKHKTAKTEQKEKTTSQSSKPISPITVATAVLLVGGSYYANKKFSEQKRVEAEKDLESRIKKYDELDISNEVANKIHTFDPNFSKHKMLAYAKELFVALQHAWTLKQWEKVRQFESDHLYRSHYNQLQEFVRNEKTNVVEKIDVRDARLLHFEEDGSQDILTISLDVVMRDYIRDDKTKQVLEGDKDEDIYMQYELIFTRVHGTLSKEVKLEIFECPNCGAKNSINENGVCKYCSTPREKDWVLTSLTAR